MEEIINNFKILVGGYFGIREMDEYSLKIYVLKDIEDYIRKFVKVNKIDINFMDEVAKIEKISLKRKLQDSLLILRKINGPLELELLIKKRISKMNSPEYNY